MVKHQKIKITMIDSSHPYIYIDPSSSFKQHCDQLLTKKKGLEKKSVKKEGKKWIVVHILLYIHYKMNDPFFLIMHYNLSLSFIPYYGLRPFSCCRSFHSTAGYCHCVHDLLMSILIGLVFFVQPLFAVPFLYSKFLVSELIN